MEVYQASNAQEALVKQRLFLATHDFWEGIVYMLV
jgi:hypothetical protein